VAASVVSLGANGGRGVVLAIDDGAEIFVRKVMPRALAQRSQTSNDLGVTRCFSYWHRLALLKPARAATAR